MSIDSVLEQCSEQGRGPTTAVAASFGSLLKGWNGITHGVYFRRAFHINRWPARLASHPSADTQCVCYVIFEFELHTNAASTSPYLQF